VPLAVRVRDGSFDAARPGHRRALLEDELLAGFPLELRELQALFRRAVADGDVGWARSLAGNFEVRGGGSLRKLPAKVSGRGFYRRNGIARGDRGTREPWISGRE